MISMASTHYLMAFLFAHLEGRIVRSSQEMGNIRTELRNRAGGSLVVYQEKMVTILMVYKAGTSRIMNVTFKSLERHNAGYPYRMHLIVDSKDPEGYKEAVQFIGRIPVVVSIGSYDVGIPGSSSGQHGRLLDAAIKDVTTDYVMTMDSDCFPIADDWMKKLIDPMLANTQIISSGIAWPWIPPPETVQKDSLEYRIRSQQCLENTHPACQIIRADVFKKNGWKFADSEGDDTNFGFLKKARIMGYKVVGLVPTRGPLPDDPKELDPEFNRHESIIFGDLIYHHVGASRECTGELKKTGIFQISRDRVYNELGAEWMLQAGNAHVFVKDREEEVAQFKMKMMYDQIVTHLQTHDGIFNRDWA
jgi:hypothetical protein